MRDGPIDFHRAGARADAGASARSTWARVVGVFGMPREGLRRRPLESLAAAWLIDRANDFAARADGLRGRARATGAFLALPVRPNAGRAAFCTGTAATTSSFMAGSRPPREANKHPRGLPPPTHLPP